MRNWSLSTKIWSVIGILCLAYVGTSALSVREFLGLRSMMEDLTGHVTRREQLINEIRDDQRRLSIVVFESIVQENPEVLAKLAKTFDEILKKKGADFAEYESIYTEKDKELFVKYKEAFGPYLAAAIKARELAAQNKKKEATDVILSVQNNLATMREYAENLKETSHKDWAARSAEINTLATQSATLATLTSIVSILVAVSLAFVVLRSLTTAIANIVKGLSASSHQVTSASSQIASISQGLSQATTQQAASLEQTAASVEEMNSMVAKNSENANSAASTSAKSQEAVIQGKQVIQKMIESMDAINRSSEGMIETVKVIEQIDKKTKVINEIVNKTELLSFNASVEAARAGEHGKGFAVVAEEVGNLARMSGAAAEEIASLLEESIKKVNQMVSDTKKNVETGAQVTRECGLVFEEVVQNVTSVSGMATEIASASQEQARGCAEITKAMNQLDQMTQQNASTSEECATAAENLSAQAEALKNAIQHLTTTVNGNRAQEITTDLVASPAASTVRKEPVQKAPSNVVHLKSHKAKSAAPKPMVAFKKASGDVPHYDDEGFKDI